MNNDWVSHIGKLITALAPLGTLFLGFYGHKWKDHANVIFGQTKLEGIYAGTQKDLLVQIDQLTKDKIDLANDIVSLKQEVSDLKITIQNLTDKLEDAGISVEKKG